MNDEIKEILEQLDIVVNKLLPMLILAPEYTKTLLEYITNLQEENEVLKEQKKEAIEYIEDNTYEAYGTDYMDLTGIKELLNILNGGDEEWKYFY